MSSSENFLVDLTVALIRKKKLFVATFLMVLCIGLGYVLLTPSSYKYVTLIKLAQDGEGALLESRDDVLANIESRWLPEVASEFKDGRGYTPEFNVDFSEVGSTHLLLSTVAPSSAGDGISWFHQSVAEKLVVSQSELERILREKLKAQIKAAERAPGIGQIDNASESSESASIEYLMSVRGRLEGIQSAEAKVIAQRSDDPIGIGVTLAVGLIFLQSFVAAVVVVLFYYFIQRVNGVIRNEEGRP
tara:strand:- start:10959 stop:11696 length:738 start_codon:yes stop_codon:yes gene_type:complete